MPKRIVAADTVEVATNLLHRLQNEGWVVAGLEWDVEYVDSPKGPRLPVGAEVVVRLVPIR